MNAVTLLRSVLIKCVIIDLCFNDGAVMVNEMKSALRLVGLCAVLGLSSIAIGAEYHLSPNGDDNDSGRQGQPWKSLARANNALRAGDVIYLHTGVYTGDIAPTRSGQLGKPITYAAAAGALPVIDKGRRLQGGWEKVSGTDGIDAIYRKKGPHSDKGMVREDDLETNGRNTLYWNRGYQTNREVQTKWVIERPGDYYHQGGYFYVRTTDSRHPDEHELIELLDIPIQVKGLQHIVIDGLTIQNAQKYVDASNANYITIQNCTLQYSKGYAALHWDNGNYWVIRNNIIRAHGSINAHKGDVFTIGNANHSLIEGNRISFSAHLVMKLGGNSKYTIIRNNHFSNAYGKIISVSASATHTLVENNDFTDAPTADMLPLTHYSDHTGLQIGGEHTIVRFNRFYSSSGGLSFAATDYPVHGELRDHVVVHNTIIGNRAVLRNKGDAVSFFKEVIRRPLIVNNIFANNHTKGGRGGQIGFNNGVLDRTTMKAMQPVIENNVIYSANRPNEVFQDFMSVDDFERSWSEYAKNNLASDPRVHGEKFNFALQADSPAIDAGRYLTHTVGSGDGNQILVHDARPFYDGFTINGGDWIRVGGQLGRVTKVDYPNNMLSVDRTLTWQNGDGVSYDYSGIRPDIGALEFSGEISATRSNLPTGLVFTK